MTLVNTVPVECHAVLVSQLMGGDIVAMHGRAGRVTTLDRTDKAVTRLEVLFASGVVATIKADPSDRLDVLYR